MNSWDFPPPPKPSNWSQVEKSNESIYYSEIYYNKGKNQAISPKLYHQVIQTNRNIATIR